ncbi:Sec-independent protein translocase protein TatB [Erwinia sp. INIA-01]|uniref:Sec-independent protein translocase protein TatB n=1 Tax=Erwinia sp. INIA01 TaxID=2991500 RepID=UPI002225730F|nr:Sec-independent protein translocase protein TatB [Erwinia sp. INIA01]MCW1877521.1 Sec-independent protein translocase protein TatB [Erwinia sp. INIA01]
MFDIGFSELVLVFIIGLVVLGPQRLPVAVKTVVGWIRALRSLATSVQNELAQELKLQELQDGLKKIEKASMDSLSPELKASVEELKQTAESFKRSYLGDNEKAADEEAHTIHNPLVKNETPHDGATPSQADHQASAPAQAPEPAGVSTEPSVAAAAEPKAPKIPEAESAVSLQKPVTPTASPVAEKSTQPSDER